QLYRVTPDVRAPYTEGVEFLLVAGHSSIQAQRGTPLWHVGELPGAVLIPRGGGRVIVVADPTLLTGRALQREDQNGVVSDNVVFLYNVAARDARDGRVYFDEYHHGLRSGGGFWGYLHYHGQHWTVLLALLCVGVAAWGVAVRLGPAVPTPRE